MTHQERLRQLRKEKKFSQEKMAQLLGITQAGYSSYEVGLHKMHLDAFIRLCDFYNVSADYLLGLSDVRERR